MLAQRSLLPIAFGLVALLAAACSASGGDQPEPGELFPERPHASDTSDVIFGAADLRDGFTVLDGYAVSGVLPAPEGASRGGFLIDLWDGVGDVPLAVEVRGVEPNGTTSGWAPADVTWREGVHAVLRADLPGTFGATQIRLFADLTSLVENLTYGAIVPSVEESEAAGDHDGTGQVFSEHAERSGQPARHDRHTDDRGWRFERRTGERRLLVVRPRSGQLHALRQRARLSSGIEAHHDRVGRRHLGVDRARAGPLS